MKMAGMLLALALTAQAAPVFISEYVEPSTGNTKALEIYNGSGAAIDMANYRIGKASNGANTPTYFTLSGSVAAGDVFVACNSGSVAEVLAVADYTNSGLDWNGDDFVGLYQLVSGSPVLIDAIGVLGTDPGSAWSVAGDAAGTANHTLARKGSILQGNTNWTSSAGTDAASSEWTVLAAQTFSGLGNHTLDGGNLAPVLASLGHTPTTPAAGQAATVSVEASDDGGLASVVLQYQLNGGAFNDVAMSAGAAPLYTGVIPGQAAGTLVGYRVLATDGPGLSTLLSGSGYTVPSASQIPPLVAGVEHDPANPTSSQAVTVSAEVSDDGELAAVTLRYWVDGGTEQSLAMVAGPEPVWSGNIPAQAAGSAVTYQVSALDDQGLATNSATGGYSVSGGGGGGNPVTPPVFVESSLSLGTILTTGGGSAVAHLQNPGSTPVVVEALSIVGGPFTCLPTWLTIPAGGSAAVTVSLAPPHNLQYSGWLVASGDWGAVALPLSAAGDYPGTTWDSTFNLSGTALKNQLNSLVSGHTALSYDGARQYMFSTLDNVNGWVECVYTGLDVQTTGIPDNSVMNTEHTWPQSYGAEGTARTDLHHLYPTDSGFNSSRGNLPFGEVVTSSSGYPQLGCDRGTNATGATVFEPRAEHKGDCARSVMYFALRYGNLESFLSLAGQETVLRAWHLADPVSDKERTRNNGIESVQHNRNPFVDQPGLLSRINSLAGSADLPATAASLFAYPDTLQLACEGSATTAYLWLGNGGGSALSISSALATDAACVQVASAPASLAAGAGAPLAVTVSGPCDGLATITVNSSVGTRSIPLLWSWAANTPPDAPLAQLEWRSGELWLDWEDIAGATGYRVESCPALGGSWSPAGTPAASELSLSGESASTRLYRVVAIR